MNIEELIKLVQVSYCHSSRINVGSGENLIKPGEVLGLGMRPALAYIGKENINKDELIEQIKLEISDEAKSCCCDNEGEWDKESLGMFMHSRIEFNPLIGKFINEYITPW